MTGEPRDERFRRMVEEMPPDAAMRDVTPDAPFYRDASPEDDKLYGLVFQALEEDAYPPLTDLAAAVEARLAHEGTLKSSPSGAASAFRSRRTSARPVRPSALELGLAAALLAAGVVLVPAPTLPFGLLFDVLHRHWSDANLDLPLVSGLAALLLLLLDRAMPRTSTNRRHGRTFQGRT